ncbi:hypothetical protein BZG35_00400 [Brevundimonas sp. LM2]|uniref:P-loop NTPase fold protein n=1 Tax=Brevundimonas sp. LM2 TaxID=1938605 RepID=UPI000983DB85|nr:P-loop NTPase fold protein [Brevundimonas sp. LM2]AQR60283.1 hypothetical protein BZG35_00400 [Brevundimonas sp. LM2]
MHDDTTRVTPPTDHSTTVSIAEHDPNEAIISYLDSYLAAQAKLQYAVLLEGPWGSGKTFFIQRYLELVNQPYIYVSMFGVASASEIDDQILRQIHPILTSRPVRLAGIVAKGILKGTLKIDLNDDGKDDGTISSTLPDVKISDFAKNAAGRILVFDDLERASMKIPDVLGYINAIVEHEDIRCIIIANEKEMDREDVYFKRIKEKLIGQTLRLIPSIDDAYPEITTLIDNLWVRDFLESHKDEVLETFSLSGVSNLRVLKHALWDFERVARVISDEDRSHTDAMAHIARVIVALSIEVRTGQLTIEDLNELKGNRYSRLFGAGKDREPSAMERAEDKYTGLELRPSFLDVDLVCDLLSKGYVDADQFRASLHRSAPFVPTSEEPAWRTVWHGFERTDAEFGTALARLQDQFVGREILVPGEILHLISLWLWLAKIEAIPKTVPEAAAEAKAYIDDLYSAGKLSPQLHEDFGSFSMRFGTGYGGLGFMEPEAPEFREAAKYFQAKRADADKDLNPERAKSLLEDLKSDPDTFYRRVTVTNNSDSLHYNMPVLASMEPDDFVSALLAQHPAHQRTILSALKVRYEHGQLSGRLLSEKQWLEKVRSAVLESAEKLDPMPRYRTQRNVQWFLNPSLNLDGESDDQPALAPG